MPINDTNRDSSVAFVSNEYTSLLFKEINDSDDDYLDVPGITDWSVSGTTTPTRDVVDARGPTQKRSGHLRIPEISVSSLYLPQDRAWRRLKEAQEDGTLLSFRIETNGVKVWESSLANGDLPAKGLKFVITGTNAGSATARAKPTITAQTSEDGHEVMPTIEQAVVGRGAVLSTYALDTSPNPDVETIRDYVVDKVATSATTLATPAGGTAPLEVLTSAFAAAGAVADHASTGARLRTIWNPPPLRLEFVATVTQGADMSLPLDSEMTTELMLQPRTQLPDWVIFTY